MSRSGSKRTASADDSVPSAPETVTRSDPATTCAAVITIASSITVPVPSWVRGPQPLDRSCTVAATTRVASMSVVEPTTGSTARTESTGSETPDTASFESAPHPATGPATAASATSTAAQVEGRVTTDP